MSEVLNKWDTGAAAWNEFCKNYGRPLGLKGGQNSWVNFQRKYVEQLLACGIARRVSKRRMIVVDKERFGPAAFDLLTLGKLPDDGAADSS